MGELIIHQGRGKGGSHLYELTVGGENFSPPDDQEGAKISGEKIAPGVKTLHPLGGENFSEGVKPASPKPSLRRSSTPRKTKPSENPPPYPLIEWYLAQIGKQRQDIKDQTWMSKQGRAINTMRERHYSDDQIQRHVAFLLGQTWRDQTPDFMTATSTIPTWVNSGEPSLPKSNTRTNGHSKERVPSQGDADYEAYRQRQLRAVGRES
jgi:hypothetical protein